MAATYEELLTLRNRLISAHGDELTTIASMINFFWMLSDRVPAHVREANFNLLVPIVNKYLEGRGYSQDRLHAALHDMHYANETIRLLGEIPE